MKGLRLINSATFGFVEYTFTSGQFPNTSLYSPFAGSITKNGILSWCNSESIWYTALLFPDPVEPVIKVCIFKLLLSNSTIFFVI